MKRLPLIALTLITLTASAQQIIQVTNFTDAQLDSIIKSIIKEYRLTSGGYEKKQVQLGIRAGISASWFNSGDKNYSGMERLYGSVIAGLYGKIPLSTRNALQIEFNYAQYGAKNPKANDRTFKTTYIQLPVTLSHQMGDFSLQFGAYASELVRAKNNDFYTPGSENFGWSVGNKHWGWFHSLDWGLVFGAGIDLHPLSLQIHYRHGLDNVRHDDYGWDGTRDWNYEGNHNASLDCSLYIPLNIINQ